MSSSKTQKDESSHVKLVPSYTAEKDITPFSKEVKISDKDLDLIETVCPHFRILEEKYSQYKNPDPETGTPNVEPVKWSPRHSLNTFKEILAQADLSKGLIVQPTRLTKIYVWDSATGKENPYLEVKLLVVGTRSDGTDTNLTSITVGSYEYPTQFREDPKEGWLPVNSKFVKHHYLPFTKENVLKYSRWKNGNEQTNPHTKKYVVTHPKKSYSANVTEEEFLSLSDEDVIRLTEGNTYQKA